MTPAASAINSGDTYDSQQNPGFLTDDTTQAAPQPDVPDPPEFARMVPFSALQDAKYQQQADDWASQQRQDLAQQWGDIARQQLDEMRTGWQNGVQSAINSGDTYESQPQTAPEPTPDVNPVTAEPASNPLIDQFFSGLGGLVDKLKGAAVQPGAGAGVDENSPLGPAANPAEAPLGAAGAAGLQTVQNALSTEVPGTGSTTNEQPGMPDPGSPLGPPQGTPNQTVGSELANALQVATSAELPRAAGEVVMAAGQALPREFGGSALSQAAMEMKGIPGMAGAAEDAIVPTEALTADHPIVQAVASAASDAYGKTVDPEAVANLIQSPGFNPVNLAKSTGRNGPVQNAALTAYRTANDAEMANAILKAAQDATGKAEPTVDEMWDSIPGIGGRAAVVPATSAPSIEDLGKAGQPPAEPPTSGGTSFGDLWRTVNRGIVQAKLMNPLIHTWNMLSETLNQYIDPRQMAGIVGDFKTAESAMRDPSVAAQLVDESNGRLNLASMRPYTDDIGSAVGQAISNTPVVGGVKNAYDAVTAFNHKMLFENLGQRLQLASYQGAKRMGMDPETAAAYANAKFGQISNADRSDLMQWVGDNVAFAGKWLQGTGIQLGSLIGKPGFGGYASTLSDAQQARLAAGLRGDFLKGIGLLVGSHAIINHQLSGGKWPWQNEDGRWLDINTGQQTADGKTIYVPDPFFRRVQDAAHLLAVPIAGNPAMRAMGTTTTSALANKAAPLLGAAADIVGGAQYLAPSDQPPGITGGPPIIAPGTTDKTDLAKQMGAFAFNQISPVQVRYGAGARSPEGIKLQNPTLNFEVGPNASKAGIAAGVTGAVTGANAVVGPRDIGTKDEYFQHQEQTAYGDAAKPFQAAGVQLSTMPSTFTAGTGSNKVSVPTTDADRPVFQKAYGDVLSKGVQQYQDKLTKPVLTDIEQKAFTAGKAAVEETLTKDEVQRRMGVAQSNGPSAAAGAFWKSPSSQPPSVPSSSPARPASSAGTATAFWKKA